MESVMNRLNDTTSCQIALFNSIHHQRKTFHSSAAAEIRKLQLFCQISILQPSIHRPVLTTALITWYLMFYLPTRLSLVVIHEMSEMSPF